MLVTLEYNWTSYCLLGSTLGPAVAGQSGVRRHWFSDSAVVQLVHQHAASGMVRIVETTSHISAATECSLLTASKVDGNLMWRRVND